MRTLGDFGLRTGDFDGVVLFTGVSALGVWRAFLEECTIAGDTAVAGVEGPSEVRFRFWAASSSSSLCSASAISSFLSAY